MRNQFNIKPNGRRKHSLGAAMLLLLGSGAASGDGGVTYTDIAAGAGAGIAYRRTPSAGNELWQQMKRQGVLGLGDMPMIPANGSGAPGAAILDFDNDGDLDIYVTNGPGTANSLYANQLKETGRVEFIDVGIAAGVDATDQDSTGVCFGDIDNDGDEDLLVLGYESGNRLFKNRADGTFEDISAASQVGGQGLHPSSCAMGDVNGDGLLDIAIANTFNNWDTRLPLMTYDHDFQMEQNQLLINLGGKFADISQSAGIQNSDARITWALALVDYDLDGDLDLIAADDQGPRAPAKYSGKDYGYLRVYQNDGHARFIERTQDLALEQFGAWMGLAFGDINSDRRMDIFATNIGDYASVQTGPLLNFAPVVGEWANSWFMAGETGFTRVPATKTVTTPFGWGVSVNDYDNDGDSDVLYYGGLDVGLFVDGSNPGAILQNDGQGSFSRDAVALAQSTNHSRREVRGLATGDLDNNGFVDVVSVSADNWPEAAPLMPYPVLPLGGQFDDHAFVWPTFSPVDPQNPLLGFTWNGINPVEGSLSVEMNNGENGNRWVKVKTLGSIDKLDGGRVNRDGIGAVVSFTPRRGVPVMQPVLGGSSYASEHSLEQVFGLGRARSGDLEVLWPGTKVRNRLYNVQAGERLILPEIPCSFDDTSLSFKQYHSCVKGALAELKQQGVLAESLAKRFLRSAVKAFHDARRKA